jgi:2-keto-3-deoxy-L-rhamnonate aldolase RhmA
MTTAMDATENPIMTRLRNGQPTFQLGLRSARTTDVVRVAQSTGHHSILVDLEHSTMTLDTAAALCSAASDLGLVPFVRTPERDLGVIGRLLDGGAQGIVAPRIETAAEAMAVARSCRFPPRGQRSAISAVPLVGMRPTPARDLNPRLDAATVVEVIIETPAGVAAADEIAAVDGVDIVALGANDLTAELGVPGRYDDPRVRDAVVALASACRRHGKLLMIAGVGDPATYAALAALGACSLYLTGMDTDLLHGAARARVESLSGQDQT